MIHRALMGSLERFFGILIEHYSGAFPLWLSPVQVMVLTIADRHIDYASDVAARLKKEGIRTGLNIENEKIGHKIREATIRKIPYSIIIGDKEVSEGRLSIRRLKGEGMEPLTLEDLIKHLKEEINTRR